MRAVTKQLSDAAESIFTDLGYRISGTGSEFRAERKWRVVQVSTLEEPATPPETGEYRCFVTRSEAASDVRRRLVRADPDYEWAVLAVDDDGDYDVLCEPAT
ncbi:MAG: hypothetical protein ABEI96_02735 [Haloarculaceae archaeon]